jgi:RNA polymerase sigma factor (sigma-70 family)
MFAACAVALATAVGSPSAGSAAETQAIQKIERYCTTSWRNAGIRRDDWDDCTQQALLELLSSLSPTDLQVAIEQADSEARRELNRAVWRLVKRCRREAKEISYVDTYGVSSHADLQDAWQEVEAAAKDHLSPRQLQILDLTRKGWRVAEIATTLGISAERVSDEKYKSIAKLQGRLAIA